MMSDCRKCADFEWCVKNEDCGLFKAKPETNADRFRAMSDEELAECFANISESYYKPKEGWLEWLKQEAPNETT